MLRKLLARYGSCRSAAVVTPCTISHTSDTARQGVQCPRACPCNMQVDLALQSYGRALELQPQYAEAHCNIGVIHKQAGRLEDAVAAYQHALELTPCYETIRSNLAIALTETGVQRKAAGDTAAGTALSCGCFEPCCR